MKNTLDIKNYVEKHHRIFLDRLTARQKIASIKKAPSKLQKLQNFFKRANKTTGETA